MSKFLIVISFFLYSLPVISQQSDSLKYYSLEPYDFHLQYLREDSALLIDDREFFEFRRSRIHGALFMPPSVGFDIAADTIDKNRSLFCYCYNGGRSIRALLFFYDKGFRKLYNLEGGIVAWQRDGFPVDKNRMRKKAGERESERGR
jgi:rhodanese-related sulfurtransferase